MKVLVSFLGINDYLPCRYNGSEVVRFVQTALALTQPFDRVYICCTPEVEKKNWPRLVEEFSKNSLPEPVKVSVPRGGSESELWQLFDVVGNLIENEDHISFDITHSYRSLPVLFTVLVQYLQVTKQVQLNQVVYGAFEALGFKGEVEKLPESERNAPVFDLTPFFRLNNWSSAIFAFSEYGVADPLCQLAQQEVSPLLRESKGADQSARALRCIAAIVEKHSRYVRTVRGNDLAQLKYQSSLIAQLEELDDFLLPPMRPVLEKLRDQFKGFQDADILNGIRSARWCLDHKMVQQGITLLQETVVSQLSQDSRLNEITHEDEHQQIVERRKFVSALLNVSGKKIEPDKWREGLERRMSLARILHLEWAELAEAYERLSEVRNDINHGGTSKNARKPKDIEKVFSESLVFFEKRLLHSVSDSKVSLQE